MMKTLAATRPPLTAETLAELITAAGVPCVTLVPDDAAATAVPSTPKDEGLRIVSGSMPVRICYPIPREEDGETEFHAALSRKDSHVLWLYDFVEQFRWSAWACLPHADPWITIRPEPRPATYLDGRGTEISRATGCPLIDPWPPRWAVLEHIDDADALADAILAELQAEIDACGKNRRMRASRENLGGMRRRDAERIRDAGPREFCQGVYRHDRARADAESRARDITRLGRPGVRCEAAPITGYAHCVTCFRPVYEAAGRWWHEHTECPGPRRIRDLPAEPGDWEFRGHVMTCGYCGGSISWHELLMSWVQFTGVHSIGVQTAIDETSRGPRGHVGDVVVLAEVELLVPAGGQPAGTTTFLPHRCAEIPQHLLDHLASRRAAVMDGKPVTLAVLEPDGSLSEPGPADLLEDRSRQAKARTMDRAAICALPLGEAEALLAARGEHPVAVAYGAAPAELAVQPADPQLRKTARRVADLSRRHRCAARLSWGTATTCIFASHDAAVAFIAAATAIAEPGWTITPTARPPWWETSEDQTDGWRRDQ